MSIQEEYLERLNRKYDEWISQIYRGEVITIDVDRVDFVDDPSSLDDVVGRIESLKKSGLYWTANPFSPKRSRVRSRNSSERGRLACCSTRWTETRSSVSGTILTKRHRSLLSSLSRGAGTAFICPSGPHLRSTRRCTAELTTCRRRARCFWRLFSVP